MNAIGIHALVWVGDWSPASIRTATESTRKTGFDLLEIPVLDPTHVDVELTRKLLEDNQLEAACSLGLTPATNICSEEATTVARGKDVLAAALDVAAGLGAANLCGVLYSALGKATQPLSPAGRSNAVAVMAWLAEQAASHGIQVSLEVVNRYESNLANTAQDMLGFISEADPRLGLHLDSYHMNIEESDFRAPVHAGADHLTYVHVGESHRGYLGTGTVDFDGLFTALRDIDYQGPVTFESFSSAVVHHELSNTLAVWRNLWTDSTDLAEHAQRFILERLQVGA